MKWITLNQSVQGASHKSRNLICQDKNTIKQLAEGVYIAAVADGHGSEKCRFSDMGAQLAIKAFKRLIDNAYKQTNGNREEFIKLLLSNDVDKFVQNMYYIWLKWIQQIFDKAKDQYDDLKDMKEVDPELFGTTFLGTVIADDFVYAIQIGDGDIAYIDENGFKRVIEPEKFLGTETYSLSNEKPWKYAKSYFQRKRLEESLPCMFILTTDGFANSFRDEEQYRVSCVDYYDTICKYGQREVEIHLKEWLDQTSAEGCGDDITFVAVGVVDDTNESTE